MAEGEFALMQHHLEAAMNSASVIKSASGCNNDIYAMLVDAAVQQRDQAGMQKYAPLAEEFAKDFGHRLYMAIAHRAWGVMHTLTGEYPQAESRFEQALKIFNDYPAPWQIGRTLFEMGELERTQLKVEPASDYYLRALAAFEELRAVPDIMRTHAALETLSHDPHSLSHGPSPVS